VSKTIAILTSGGDSPGMNAAIRAATLVAVAKGHRMLGVRHGYRGLLEGKLAPIGADDVNDILRDGRTFLHSARCKPFLEPGPRAEARDVLVRHGADGLIVIGGNGSLTGLELLLPGRPACRSRCDQAVVGGTEPPGPWRATAFDDLEDVFLL